MFCSTSSSLNELELARLFKPGFKPVDTIRLEAALKILPAKFNGAYQEDLELFLEQCEFAIMFANEKAKQRLLQGIIIRLTGKARVAVKFRSIQSWNELKETLKTSLEPQRTTSHLYLELYSSKQKPEEDVMAYSTRNGKSSTKNQARPVFTVIKWDIGPETVAIKLIQPSHQPEHQQALYPKHLRGGEPTNASTQNSKNSPLSTGRQPQNSHNLIRRNILNNTAR
ncbi:CCHC-type domain-containing protein [Aphis craccivora]|uniref:CCHC-type domain-containing protein n=1 Tax=Aphis craccivora TaxID=307492 RepID=A0A6G0YQY2_APHCR|nr:CCHC-type domain-containing protein [Aphis craccivora]